MKISFQNENMTWKLKNFFVDKKTSLTWKRYVIYGFLSGIVELNRLFFLEIFNFKPHGRIRYNKWKHRSKVRVAYKIQQQGKIKYQFVFYDALILYKRHSSNNLRCVLTYQQSTKLSILVENFFDYSIETIVANERMKLQLRFL